MVLMEKRVSTISCVDKLIDNNDFIGACTQITSYDVINFFFTNKLPQKQHEKKTKLCDVIV